MNCLITFGVTEQNYVYYAVKLTKNIGLTASTLVGTAVALPEVIMDLEARSIG